MVQLGRDLPGVDLGKHRAQPLSHLRRVHALVVTHIAIFLSQAKPSAASSRTPMS